MMRSRSVLSSANHCLQSFWCTTHAMWMQAEEGNVAGKQRGREGGREPDKQADRQAGRQGGRQAGKCSGWMDVWVQQRGTEQEAK